MKKLKVKLNKFIKKNFHYQSQLIRCYFWYFLNRAELKRLLRKNFKKEFKQLQESSKVAILFLGTQTYINFFPNYYKQIKKYFLPNTEKDFFVFTDKIDYPPLSKKDVFVVPIKHRKFPLPMLYTFKCINKAKDKLKKYDHIIWIDADMLINTLIHEKEFFCHSKSLFCVRHPNFLSKKGTFENNPKSLAYVCPEQESSIYYQACLWGGKSKELLELLKELEKRVDIDLSNNVIARILDESHINKYLIEKKPDVYAYDPSYAYPYMRPIPKPFKKKILHIDFKKSKIFK